MSPARCERTSSACEQRVEAAEIMRNGTTTLLRRAAERGEITTADVPPRIMNLPTDLVRHEIVLRSEPMTERTLVEIADEVFPPLDTRGA